MSKQKKQPATVIELLKNIEDAVGGRECIFRGEPSDQFGKVTSSLYRKLDEPDVVPTELMATDQHKRFTEELKKLSAKYASTEADDAAPLTKGEVQADIKKLQAVVAEGQMVTGVNRKSVLQLLQRDYASGAKHRASLIKSNSETLAELQHYGGETNLIDFSESHLVALFFACNDDSYSENNGHLIVLPKQGIKEITGDKPIPEDECSIIRPLPSNRRALIQRSVMIHEPDGYLEYVDERITAIPIPSDLKNTILDYLDKFCDISVNALFPDIQGYIESQKFTRLSRLYRMQAFTRLEEGKVEEALLDYSRAIDMDNKNATLYSLRARTYESRSRYEEALEDCSRAIELCPQNDVFRASLYDTRARILMGLGHYEGALSDCNRGLELDIPNAMLRATLYNARALAQLRLNEHERALKDCNDGLKLCSQNNIRFLALYNTRAMAYENLKRYDEALKDCDRNLELVGGNFLFRIEAHLLQASIYGKREKSDKAETNLKEALKLAKQINNAPYIEQVQQLLDELDTPKPK